MSIQSDLTDIKTRSQGLKDNQVTNLAYDQTAYNNNSVASPDHYDWAQHNNIPPQTIADMKMTSQQIEKGFRLRFPILNKYFFNAFFGRVSYNLNKLNDFFYSAVDALINALGTPNGLAILDSNGRLPASQATETLMSLKGAWSASTNTPHLSDAMSGAVKGDMYICNDTGTVTFGTGNTVSFLPDDRVVYDGSKWCRWSAGNVRRVCELLPDGNGNIDLTQQSDIYKVLNKKIIGELFYWGIGRKWVQCTGGETFQFSSVKYDNGLWVAGGMGNTSGEGLWWSEDGKTWTRTSTTDAQTLVVRGLLYAEGIWTACTSNGLWWSEDGKAWTRSPETVGAVSWSADYGNGLWVACDNRNNGGLWWSENGKDWTHVAGIGFYYVKYANGMWIAITGGGVCYSTTGKDFTTVISTASYYSTYANGMWVACTVSGIYWSTDGIGWTKGTGGDTTTFTMVSYANGLWVAGTVGAGIFTSTDGKNWTQKVVSSDTFCAVKYANSIWLAGTEASGLYLSNDGENWFVINSNITLVSAVPFGNIAFDQGMFIVASTAGLWYSDWTTIE